MRVNKSFTFDMELLQEIEHYALTNQLSTNYAIERLARYGLIHARQMEEMEKEKSRLSAHHSEEKVRKLLP